MECGEKLEEEVIEKIEEYLDGTTAEIPLQSVDATAATLILQKPLYRISDFTNNNALFKNMRWTDSLMEAPPAIAKNVFDAPVGRM